MSRPSLGSDLRLIEAARELLPKTGCSGLKLRDVADKARVNLGMFHYHFKNKDAFLHCVLQTIYDKDFFDRFSAELTADRSPEKNLREALRVFARFVRDERALIAMLMKDVLAGEKVVHSFLRENFPRHVFPLLGLLRELEEKGELVDSSVINLFVMMMSGLHGPNVMLEALQRNAPKGVLSIIQTVGGMDITSDEAIDARIDALVNGILRKRRAR